MSNFLHRLAGRTIGANPVAQPVVPAVFTPDLRMEGGTTRTGFVEPMRTEPILEKISSDSARQATLPRSLEGFDFASPDENPLVQPLQHPANSRPPLQPSKMLPETFADEPNARLHDSTLDARLGRAPILEANSTESLPAFSGSRPGAAIQTNRRLTQPDNFSHGNEPQSPIIRVTIGRIDVRAQFSASSPTSAATPQRKTSAFSLDEYLKQRSEGKR